MKHALVQTGGYSLPLIGLPEDCTLETCDGCHKRFNVRQITYGLTGRFLCTRCLTYDRPQEPALSHSNPQQTTTTNTKG